MRVRHPEERNIVFPKIASAIRWSLMKTVFERTENTSGTIEEQVISRVRPAVSPVRRGPAASVPGIIAEWQQHGPATLGGLAGRKLRFAFAPAQFVTIAR